MTVTVRHPGVVRTGGRLMVVDPFAERGTLTPAQADAMRLRHRMSMLLGGFLVLFGIAVGAALGSIVQSSFAAVSPVSPGVEGGLVAGWTPGLDVAGALIGAIIAVLFLAWKAERRRLQRRLGSGHQPSRWIDPMNEHLRGLDDSVSWPELWTLARMYANAECAQRRAGEGGDAAGDAVGDSAGDDAGEQGAEAAPASAEDARRALERTAELMGVTVPFGPLPSPQASLDNTRR